MDLRRNGNTASHKRRARSTDPKTISKDRVESLITELGNCRDHLSTTYKSAHPTQRGIDYLDYTTETTKKFIEVVNDKYDPYLKEKSVGKVLQKLQYTIKLAKFKVKEVEENVQDDNDDPEVIIKGSSKRKSFQESLPHWKH